MNPTNRFHASGDDLLDHVKDQIEFMSQEIASLEADRDWWRTQANVLVELLGRKDRMDPTVASAPSDEFP